MRYGVVCVLLLALAGCGQGASSPAAQLSAQGGGSTGAYRAALANLGGYCTQSPQQLANDALSSQSIEAKKGVDESPLAVLYGVYARIPGDATRMDCLDVFASYVFDRTGG